MPTYNVIKTIDDEIDVILTMKADSVTSIPTEIVSGTLAGFARDIVEKDNATVEQIAYRCGSYSALVEVNPVEEAIARGRAAIDARAKVKKTEPDDEIDLQVDGALDDDDEGYDEDTLRSLPLNALRAVARDFGIDPKGMDQDAIVTSIMDTDDDEGYDEDTSRSHQWVTVYDLASGWCTITAAENRQHDHNEWQPLVVDEARSDPAGAFVVYKGGFTGEDLMVRMVLPDGLGVHLPPGLNRTMLIYPTLEPPWGRGETGDQFVWWSEGHLWEDG